MANPNVTTDFVDTIELLIVDDHPTARDWTAEQLGRCERMHVVATAGDGAETYRVLNQMSPTCVVLDIRLPDCSGVDVARHIRSTQPGVAIVVLTGYPDPAYRAALTRLGIRHLLSKAASASELEGAVRDAVAATRRVLPTSVLIVEDHPLTGHGTSVVLEQAGFNIVGVASSGAAALDLANRYHPDVVVLDLQLPDMSGTMVAQQLLRSRPQPKILILTAQRDDAYEKALRRVGVSGYLTKETSPRELIAAIQSVVQGSGAKIGMSQAEDDRGTALSQREREILVLVAQGLTNAEIADAMHVSTKTVEYHLTGMFQRFDVRNRTELTHFASASGLI